MIPDGTVLGQRYVVEAVLGQGGMGSVYLARHVDVGRRFAIKVLHRSLITNPKVVTRFRREAELAGRLRHENVVSVLDMGLTDDAEQYLVMEYAPGVPLTALLDRDGPMSEARVLELTCQLCDGLQHAHDMGLIHRDFKPDNVIVEELEGGREVARIVDFGVAILREDAGEVSGDRLTTKGLVVGTPHYMAPEQARGSGVDHRVDLFALGLLMYELLAGKAPFEGDGVDVARANLHMMTPPIGVRAPGVKVEPVLEALVRKLLAKKPDDRMPNARAVRELIELYRRDCRAAAALLGVRDVTIPSTGGMPPLHQAVVVGRSRSANHSAAPYQQLLSEEAPPLPAPGPAPTPAPRPLPTTEKLPVRSTHKRFIAATVIAAAALFAVVWFTQSRPAASTAAGKDTTTQLAAAPTQSPLPPPLRASAPPATPVAPVEDPEPAPVAEPTPVVPVAKPRVAKPVTMPKTDEAPNRAIPTADDVAKLYAVIGRELTAASRVDPDATVDLWPRYRWVRLLDAIATAPKRTETYALLQRLRSDLRTATTTRGPGSAGD